jgi:hypothetical protein
MSSRSLIIMLGLTLLIALPSRVVRGETAPASDLNDFAGDNSSQAFDVHPEIGPNQGTCSCAAGNMDQSDVPIEGVLVLPRHSCPNPTYSNVVQDDKGETVVGSIDSVSDDAVEFGRILWRADAPPLAPGSTYSYAFVAKDSNLVEAELGCETTASFTTRDDSFPEMEKPTTLFSNFSAIWVESFECYAPRYTVRVNKHPASALSLYHRYAISVVREGEANWIKWQSGDGSATFDHIADWSTGWEVQIPFADVYCLRIEAWEIVNGTLTSEDICVVPQDLIGLTTNSGAPDEVVPPDAQLCDAGAAVITAPDPPWSDASATDTTAPDPACREHGGCHQGRPMDVFPALVFLLLLALINRRTRRCDGDTL